MDPLINQTENQRLSRRSPADATTRIYGKADKKSLPSTAGNYADGVRKPASWTVFCKTNKDGLRGDEEGNVWTLAGRLDAKDEKEGTG